MSDTEWKPRVGIDAAYSGAIAENRVHLLYTSRGNFCSDLRHSLGAVACVNSVGDVPSYLAADVVSALRSRYADEPVWAAIRRTFSPEHRLDAAGDFQPYVHALLTGQNREALKVYALTDTARRLLQRCDLYGSEAPMESRRAHRLELVFSKAARERIAARTSAPACSCVVIRLDDATLYRFRTGIDLVDVALRIERVDHRIPAPVELCEAVMALSRFNSVRWRPLEAAASRLEGHEHVVAGEMADCEEPSQDSSRAELFSFGRLVRALLGRKRIEGVASSRVFSVSFVRFDSPVEAAAASSFAARLARHYNDDYSLVESPENIVWLRDFTNVLTGSALEGTATVVGAPSAQLELPEFVVDFYKNAFRRYYLPIAILNLHERAELVDITVQSAFWPSTEQVDESVLSRLQAIQDRSLKLRLCFRFSEVSQISMHNAYNRGLRRVFGLDRMMQELNQDIVEIDGFMREQSRQRLERRWRSANVLGAAGMTGLIVFIAVFEALQYTLKDSEVLSGGMPVLIAAGAALLAMVVTAVRVSDR